MSGSSNISEELYWDINYNNRTPTLVSTTLFIERPSVRLFPIDWLNLDG